MAKMYIWLSLELKKVTVFFLLSDIAEGCEILGPLVSYVTAFFFQILLFSLVIQSPTLAYVIYRLSTFTYSFCGWGMYTILGPHVC